MGDIAGKIISTLITIVVAVAASGAVWLTANLIVGQARHHWSRFSTLAMGVGGFAFGIVLAGNRALVGTGTIEVETDRNDKVLGWITTGGWFERFTAWVWFPLVAAVAFAVIGAVVGRQTDQRIRQLHRGFTKIQQQIFAVTKAVRHMVKARGALTLSQTLGTGDDAHCAVIEFAYCKCGHRSTDFH